MAAPLCELLPKNVKCILSSKHTKTIHALQKSLSSPTVLFLPDFKMAFQLEINAFDLVISGDLS